MPSYRLPVCFAACALFLTPAVTAAQQRTDLGTLSIQVRPPDAEIVIDGERWLGSEIAGVMVIQLPPGVHRVELRSRGGRPYSTEVTIRAGETTPLNVGLQSAEMRAPEPSAPPPAPPPPGGIRGRSVSEDGFVMAPDFRVSEIGDETAKFVGAYGGWVFAGRLLVGGGGYWQADSTSGLHLAYGGPVVEWRMFPDRKVGFTLHGLVGAGQLYADHDSFRYTTNVGRRPRGRIVPYSPYPYGYSDIFFVGEPEAQIVLRLGPSFRVQGGVGYRATSANGLDGATGSISVQFGR